MDIENVNSEWSPRFKFTRHTRDISFKAMAEFYDDQTASEAPPHPLSKQDEACFPSDKELYIPLTKPLYFIAANSPTV